MKKKERDLVVLQCPLCRVSLDRILGTVAEIWKISQFFRVWIRDCDWMEDSAWFCLKWAKTLIFSEFWIVGLELFTLGDCLRWWYLTLLLWVWKKIAYTVISDWDFDYRFWTRCIGWRSPFLVFFFFFFVFHFLTGNIFGWEKNLPRLSGFCGPF